MDQLWRDLEREQGIEVALRQRLLQLEAELKDCREAQKALSAPPEGQAELEALCSAIEQLRRGNEELGEQLTRSERQEAELAMELWQLRVRMEGVAQQRKSVTSSYRGQYQ